MTIKFFSIDLKKKSIFLILWGPSSAGEHMTEDHGVPGSTPGGPIFQKVYKNKITK